MTVEDTCRLLESALGLPALSLQPDAPIHDLREWDSFGVLSVVADIEDKLHVTPEPAHLAECRSAAELHAVLVKLEAAQPRA